MTGVVLLCCVPDPESEVGRVVLDAPSVTALCQALEWRKSGDGRLEGLAVGPPEWEEALREALALGLDGVQRPWAAEGPGLDIAATACAVAAALPEATSLVFAGSAATGAGSGLLPAAVAGVLGWPMVTGVVRARQLQDSVELEAIAGPASRHIYRLGAAAVLASARLPPPPIYAPLARRLAAARATIACGDTSDLAAEAAARSTFAGFGPGKPRTKHLLKPSAAARPGDRLSQLMSGGAQRSGSKLAGDAADLARQVADILDKAGILPH